MHIDRLLNAVSLYDPLMMIENYLDSTKHLETMRNRIMIYMNITVPYFVLTLTIIAACDRVSYSPKSLKVR